MPPLGPFRAALETTRRSRASFPLGSGALLGEEAGLLQLALQLAGLEHLAHDVATADELALDVELRDGGPVGIGLDAVTQILDHVGVGYKGLNVLESADLRNGIKTYSNWPTIPQLYVKGEFVGGCDIIREMFQAGELQQLLADKGVAVSAGASA